MRRIRNYIFTCILCFMSFPSFAAAHRVGVLNPVVEGNISEVDATLVKGAVKDKIESNLKKYTDFIIVSTNSNELKNLQKESQSIGMDKETAIRMGKILAADSVLNVSIRKKTNVFSLVIKFVDLTTGEIKASCQREVNNETLLWSGYACAVDLITIDLCDTLNIPLSSAQIYVLKNGDNDLSISDQITLFQNDTKRYQQLLKEYDDELKSLAISSDRYSKEQEIALLAQKELMEQKLLSSKAAEERYIKMQELQAEEALKDAERTDVQKKKRAEIELLVKQKAEEVRTERNKLTSVIEQIGNIENKKRAYFEIQENLEKRIDEINYETQIEIDSKQNEILSRPYPKAWLDINGQPISEAVNARIEEFDEIKKEIQKRSRNEVSLLEETIHPQQQELLSQIQKDNTELWSQVRFASSVTDDLSVIVGLYDGYKRGWIARLYFNVDGIDIFQKEIFLSYETVTGKKVTNILSQDYIDTVDLYDSIFSRGIPIIIFQLIYSVEAYNIQNPSTYMFTINYLKLTNIQKGQEDSEIMKIEETRTLKLSPSYDMRGIAGYSEEKIDRQREEKKEAIKEEGREEKKSVEQKKVKTEKKADDKKDEIKNRKNTLTLDVFSKINYFDGGIGVSVIRDIPIAKHFFITIGGDTAILASGGFLSILAGCGVNIFQVNKSCAYGRVLVGGEVNLDDIDNSYMMLRGCVGVTLGGVNLEYSLDYGIGDYTIDRFSIGYTFFFN